MLYSLNPSRVGTQDASQVARRKYRTKPAKLNTAEFSPGLVTYEGPTQRAAEKRPSITHAA
jgi:hypothetical protein